MLSRGLTPLTPYGHSKAPWPCRCNNCGHEFNSTYDRAKQGSGCPKCAQQKINEKAAEIRRLSPSQVDKVFLKSKVKPLGEFRSTKKPLDFLCLVCGGRFNTKLRNTADEWIVVCPSCSLNAKQEKLRPLIIQFETLLQANDAEILLGTITAKTSVLKVRCAQGHEFSRSLEKLVQNERFCSVCSPRKFGYRAPRPPGAAQDEAETRTLLLEKGWKLLSPVGQLSQSVLVACDFCNSQKEAQLSHFLSGKRICQCRKDKAKSEKNRQLLEEISAERGGRLISEAPARTKDKAQFECSNGHQWWAQMGSVVNAKTWCLECAGNAPRSLDDLRAIVLERGGKLLTDEYKGVDGTYDFECNLGHEFSNMFKKVENGQWCPVCSKGSKSEEIARTTLEQLFEKKFSRRRPKWLRNSRGYSMELDGYNESLGVAFEYQGYQHFKADHWGTDLEQRIADDNLKAQICSERGIVLLQITHEMEYLTFPNEIRKQLEAAGFDTSHVDFDKAIDLSKAYIRDDRLVELKTLLKLKNIEVLSNAWLGVNEKYKLHCNVCGSEWEARGNAFFNTRASAGCKHCATRVPGNKMDISVLVNFAEEHGGKLLSQTYVRRNHTYQWSCAKGHIFDANFNNLKYRGEFCPDCEGRQKKLKISHEQAEAEYKKHNLLLLEPFTMRSRYLKVRCTVCEQESLQALDNLREGKPACKPCQFEKKKTAAELVMLNAGVRPLDPYVSNTSKWRCECLTCHREITPVVVNVQKGQGACIHCGYDKARATRSKKHGS